MRLRSCLALFAILLLAFGSFLQAQEDVEKAFQAAGKRFEQSDSAEEQVQIAREFLLKYPVSKHTKTVLEAAQYLCMGELRKPADFVELATWVRSKVQDAALTREIDFMLIDAYGETGDGAKLKALAHTLVTGEEITFNTLYPIIQAACSAGEWQMALDYSGQAEQFANAEAYQKEFPDNHLTAKQLEQRGNNRRGILLTYSGWAKENLGRRAEALADFKSADNLIDKHYLGFSEEKLELYWGKTLTNDGKIEEAIDKLGPAAVFGHDDELKPALRDAYNAGSDNTGGFDTFFEDLRKKIAHPVDDFTLPNYDGEKLAMSSLRGKVVLLAFWFPT